MEKLNVQSVLFTLGEEEKNSPRIRAMVEATERFAENIAVSKGLRILRKWSYAKEVCTPTTSAESKGVGFYRVAFTVADKTYLDEKADYRFGRYKRDFLAQLLGKVGNILRRLFR